jgi:hypothetical protein
LGDRNVPREKITWPVDEEPFSVDRYHSGTIVPPSPRLLMIGVDAGDIEYIEASATALPNLRRVLDRGARYDLDSTADVLTGSVWPTFYTGALPGDHGVYHPIQWDPAAIRARAALRCCGPQRREALSPLTHGKDFPLFVRALRSPAAG